MHSWQHRTVVADGRAVLLRRAASGDEDRIQHFVRALSWQSRYQRFFIPLREVPAAMLQRLVQPDDKRGATLLALSGGEGGAVIGLAQYNATIDDEAAETEAEAAVIVAEDWRRVGLARQLLTDLAVIAEAADIVRVRAGILRDNAAALRLAREVGCVVEPHSRDRHAVQVIRSLERGPWSSSGSARTQRWLGA
jgi:acetyltransferase